MSKLLKFKSKKSDKIFCRHFFKTNRKYKIEQTMENQLFY